MAEFYKGSIPILDSSGGFGDSFAPPPGQAMGMVPRDYNEFPKEMFAPPSQLKVLDKSEWDAAYDDQEKYMSSLEHKYLSGPNGTPVFVNLDQNGDGHCWAYSTGHAMMLKTLLQGRTPKRLNPHATATLLKRFNGGWCGISAKFGREVGYAEEGTGSGQWPLHSNDARYDTPELRAAMGKNKVEEDWYDVTREVWSQSMNTAQLATCGLRNIPCPSDFNWWGHSVCQVRWVRIEAGSWGPLILNSWKGWGRYGLAVLRGSQAIANGAVATLSTAA